MLKENKGLVERLIHLWKRAMSMVMVADRRAIWRSMAVPCCGHSVPRCHMSSAMPCLGLKS